jgi:hypothetical protein
MGTTEEQGQPVRHVRTVGGRREISIIKSRARILAVAFAFVAIAAVAMLVARRF